MDLAGALGLGDRACVAFVGAGGKKTAMRQLVTAGTASGQSVGYTTTAAMPPPPEIELVVDDDPDRLAESLAARHAPVAFASAWIDSPERVPEKVTGVRPGFIDRLWEGSRFDWIVCKADGARMREFKAPNDGEPVIPASATHVVPVVSLQAVGEPLTEAVVHRPERVAAIAGVDVGARITPAVVAAVLASPDGALKGIPPEATVTPVLNKADTSAGQATGETVLREALGRTERFDSGLVTSFHEDVCQAVERADDAAG
jgi:probable selenium-dependent hydroxylase accessory protein YqeC